MNNIKQVIREKGMRCNHIAQELGVSASDISNWASEERKPNQERLVALAKVLGGRLSDLYPDIKRKTIYIY